MPRSGEGSYVLNLAGFHAVSMTRSICSKCSSCRLLYSFLKPGTKLTTFTHCYFIIRCHIILLQLFHTSSYSLREDSKMKLVWGSGKIITVKKQWKMFEGMLTSTLHLYSLRQWSDHIQYTFIPMQHKSFRVAWASRWEEEWKIHNIHKIIINCHNVDETESIKTVIFTYSSELFLYSSLRDKCQSPGELLRANCCR